MATKLDITGMKFGRLTALKQNGHDTSPSRKHVRWDCVCECGNVVNVRLNALRSCGLKSCGCLKKEATHKITHHMTNTTEYRTWAHIKGRCLRPTHADFYLYGGRGIKICERWKTSFEAFYEDMGPKPKGTSIDRIDVNGDYCKENCRWADNKTQSRNKRNNRFIEFNGMNMCVTDWAKHLGINNSSLLERLNKWPIEKALSTFKENQN